MNARQKKKTYYITEYATREIYEPAEGGYYVTETIPLWSYRTTLRKAQKLLKQEFGTDQKRINYDDGFVTIEHKRGQYSHIYKGYC